MASTGAQPRRGDGEATTAANHQQQQRHRHRFVSDDLNVRVQGKILEQKEPGRIDGIRLELDLPEDEGGDAGGDDDASQHEDAISVLYPQLVSIHTRPESQTLVSINTGERLLTLETPLISDQDSDPDRDDDEDGDDNAIDDDDDDDVSDIEDGDERTEKRKPQPPPEKKKRRPVVITLHEGFLPASEATQLEESSLYSTTFRIVIDGPSYPLPHFDPSVLAPPTPAVRPHGGAAGAGMSDSNSAYGGVLNSPTLQRALLSPLLSPQRRAASQGSDMSVPPLSLGLSRASRPSFSAAERPHIDSSVAGQKRPPAPVTLLTLIPSLAPPKPSAFPTSSTTPQVGPSSAHQQHHQHNGNAHSRHTPPPAPTLAGTLTSALSTAAKRTAEEILALRRTHDAYQRRAKAELEVLEARIENARSEAGIAVAVGGTESVVRGFKTKEERAKEREERNASVSRSRERGRGEARGRSHDRDTSGSAERPPYASTAVRPSLGSASTSSGSIPNRDEAASALIRAQDEREEDERGRSRSRSRRTGPPAAAAAPGGANPSGSSVSRGRPEGSSSASSSSTNNAPVSGSATQRSRSRTKAVAEATLRAVEAAKDRQGATASPTGAAEGSPSPRMDHGQGQATLAPPPPPAQGAGSGQGGERRARSPLSRGSETAATSPDAAPTSPKPKPKQQASPAAVKESDTTNANSSSPAASGSQPLPPPASRSHPPGPAAAGSTTPAFAPSSHALVAIPETDELSIPLERTHSGGLNLDVPNDPPPAVRVEQEPEEESEPPFEMDEDVELEERDSAASVRSQQQAPALDSPSLEPETTTDAPLLASSPPRPSNQQQTPVSSSFRPGSYQRASALSASYNALLSSAKSAPSRPAVQAVSPSVHSPRSPFSALEEVTVSEDQLPPFSPPDVRSYMSTSVREEAQTALLAATLEHAERSRRVDGDGSSRGSSSVGGGGKGSAYIGPDPRDVRKGEQKIRDVLAMDVPSHRPRGGTKQHEQQSTPGRGFDDDEDDDDDAPSSEEDDTVEELVCPSNDGSRGVVMSEASADPAGNSDASSMPVGSLPIALGRPSSVNAALSSWRPDPERLWAQQRRDRKTSGSAAPPPLHSPAGRLVPEDAPGGGGSTSKSPQVTAGGQAILVSSSPSIPQSGTHASPTHPVEIGSPTIPRPADVGGGQGGSSLARSLRAQQGVGTFVQMTSSGTTAAHRRSGGEGTGSAPGPNGRDPFENERRGADRGGDSDDDRRSAERKDVKETDEEKEDDDDDDDDDDEFVPPHLVKGRRDREDEEWLSRSVPQS